MRTITFVCAYCGITASKGRRLNQERYFCSNPCAKAWVRENPVRHTLICNWCAEDFITDDANLLYCSRQCYYDHKRAKMFEYAPDAEAVKKAYMMAYGPRYLAANREKHNARTEAYRKANLDRFAAYARNWRRRNPDQQAARYAARRGAPGAFTAEEWSALKAQYNNTCLRCGRQEPEVRLEPDHVVPIKLNGASTIDNIQPLCRSCNARKHAKTIDYRPTAEVA